MTGLVLEYTYRSPIVAPFSILLLPLSLLYTSIMGKLHDVRIGGRGKDFSSPLSKDKKYRDNTCKTSFCQ